MCSLFIIWAKASLVLSFVVTRSTQMRIAPRTTGIKCYPLFLGNLETSTTTVTTRGRSTNASGNNTASASMKSRCSPARAAVAESDHRMLLQRHSAKSRDGVMWAAEDGANHRSLTPSPVVPRGCKDFASRESHDVAL